jgi:hypothetical protein
VAPPSGIEVTLELPKEVFSSGEPIDMSLIVRNAGSAPVTYWYSGYSYDFFVDGPEGVVWIWVQSFVASPGAFEQFLRQGTLDPGETLTM